MKNRKLVITLIAGAVLMLTQAGYAAQEAVQPEVTESATACVTVTKEELADTIKQAMAEALHKMALELVPQALPKKEPKYWTMNLIKRQSTETLLVLQNNVNTSHIVELQEGDSLIIELKAHAGVHWEADMMQLNPEALLYTKKTYKPQTKEELNMEGNSITTYMHFKALKKSDQGLTFNYWLAGSKTPFVSQQLRVIIGYGNYPPEDGGL